MKLLVCLIYLSCLLLTPQSHTLYHLPLRLSNIRFRFHHHETYGVFMDFGQAKESMLHFLRLIHTRLNFSFSILKLVVLSSSAHKNLRISNKFMRMSCIYQVILKIESKNLTFICYFIRMIQVATEESVIFHQVLRNYTLKVKTN